jgi:hypothetical protein
MHKNEDASPYKGDDQVRRPLAARIAQDLRFQHPDWTEEEIIVEARAQAIAQLQWKERMAT